MVSCSFFSPFFACVGPPGPRTFSVSLDRAPLGPGRDFVSPRSLRPFCVSLQGARVHFLWLRYAPRVAHSRGPKIMSVERVGSEEIRIKYIVNSPRNVR